ncbi:unnamed protein product [Strongylus vulgaris]|uniref:Uncharacterized protein n=1 Tax=Strongylus vulgaris TaxID=40348 RepID=A0A3P7KNE6_STRVU|nr:unnamed protein product [Strongylus vulgaris]
MPPPYPPYRREDMQERAMNDPHSQVYTQSTMVTFGEDGQPRVSWFFDLFSSCRAVRDGAREEMAIGHTIGDRTHIIEKKRDKDGNVRRQQRFVNLDECELVIFFITSRCVSILYVLKWLNQLMTHIKSVIVL